MEGGKVGVFEEDGKDILFEGMFINDGKRGAILVPLDARGVLVTLEDGKCFVNEVRD